MDSWRRGGGGGRGQPKRTVFSFFTLNRSCHFSLQLEMSPPTMCQLLLFSCFCCHAVCIDHLKLSLDGEVVVSYRRLEQQWTADCHTQFGIGSSCAQQQQCQFDLLTPDVLAPYPKHQSTSVVYCFVLLTKAKSFTLN